MIQKLVVVLGVSTLVTVPAFAADNAAGKSLYDVRCASCHGMGGEADGPVGKAMPPGTITNLKKGPFKLGADEAKLKELFTKGGAGLALSPLMPPQSGLSDEQLTALTAYVLELRK